MSEQAYIYLCGRMIDEIAKMRDTIQAKLPDPDLFQAVCMGYLDLMTAQIESWLMKVGETVTGSLS